jgi:hypothetical protein
MRLASRSRGLALTFALVLGVALHGPARPAAAQDPAPPTAGGANDAASAAEAATLPGTVEALFRRANELAFAENHAAALEVYGALGDVGIVDPDVEQNIAVCHARLGDLPRAIFHFERALLLRPGDEGVETALAAAEDALARARADEEGEAELARDTHFARSLVRGVSERGLAISLLLGMGLLCAAAVARRRTRSEAPRLGLTLLALFLAVFVGVSASGLVAKQGWLRQGTPAVILTDPVQLHQSPDSRSPVLATPARGGERATVLDEYEGFVRVRLGARQGWARADHVGRLR